MAGADATLSFRLTKGAFATAVLHEILDEAFTIETLDAE
jgi:tRNA(Glu) U13 pseudouridine synthase TruD